MRTSMANSEPKPKKLHTVQEDDFFPKGGKV